jgi:hypothetical protein
MKNYNDQNLENLFETIRHNNIELDPRPANSYYPSIIPLSSGAFFTMLSSILIVIGILQFQPQNQVDPEIKALYAELMIQTGGSTEFDDFEDPEDLSDFYEINSNTETSVDN